jgi:phage-related protein
MPLCRPLGDGLWAVRSICAGNRIARLRFSLVGGKIVVLHGFIEKSQKTLDEDLKLSRDDSITPRRALSGWSLVSDAK